VVFGLLDTGLLWITMTFVSKLRARADVDSAGTTGSDVEFPAGVAFGFDLAGFFVDDSRGCGSDFDG